MTLRERTKQMSQPGFADRKWMELAIELAHQCPPKESAYSVGAVIVGDDGQEIVKPM